MNTTNTSQAPAQWVGYDVIDSSGNKIGSVDTVWIDANTNNPKFIGVKTGMLGGQIHAVPADQTNVDSANQRIQVPYTDQQVKNAPTFGANSSLTQDQENQITSYYQDIGAPAGGTGQTISTTTVPVGAGSVGPGNYPIDNVTYDLLRLTAEKSRMLHELDVYLQDAQGDQPTSSLLQQLRQQDVQQVQQLWQFLMQRTG